MKKDTSILEEAEAFAKSRLSAWWFDHELQVRGFALKIAKREGGDREIITLAALLHDISAGDTFDLFHSEKSAEIAREFLKQHRADATEIDAVCNCILEHMGPLSTFGKLLEAAGKPQDYLPEPSTKESKILYDADMICLLTPKKTLWMAWRNGWQHRKTFEETVAGAMPLASAAHSSLHFEASRKLAEPYFKVTKEFLSKI